MSIHQKYNFPQVQDHFCAWKSALHAITGYLTVPSFISPKSYWVKFLCSISKSVYSFVSLVDCLLLAHTAYNGIRWLFVSLYVFPAFSSSLLLLPFVPIFKVCLLLYCTYFYSLATAHTLRIHNIRHLKHWTNWKILLLSCALVSLKSCVCYS